MSAKPCPAIGSRAKMPTVMTSEMPLPMPRSVICSPSHINSIVPVVKIKIVWVRYHQMWSVNTSLPENPGNTLAGFSQPSAVAAPHPMHSSTVK